MAPHLTPAELDYVDSLRGSHTPMQIHALLGRQRMQSNIKPLCLTAVRKVLRAVTHRRGAVETRGRKRRVSSRGIEALDKARQRLQQRAGGEEEVTWKQIIKAARVKTIHPTTAARRLAAAGKDIKWRRPREKPERTQEQMADRVQSCKRLLRLPKNYFMEQVDLIMDNKSWPIPITAKAKRHYRKLKVRGHLRTRKEGLGQAYTKPNPKKHRANLWGVVQVCAGICKDRVVMWEYLPAVWSGKTAVDLYQGAVIKTLRRCCGRKKKYVIVEDNDPTGYKSKPAILAKRKLGIHPIQWPTYSPELMPLDYFLWKDIERRMDVGTTPRAETRAAFLKRLQRTALGTHRAVIRKALAQMRIRFKAVVDNKGGHITMD